MLYNLSSPLGVDSARAKLDLLIKKGCFIELTEKMPKRTISQNRYLHLILQFFATQYKETTDWVKEMYYKRHCNPDIFIREKYDPLIGKKVEFLRSSADLTTEEMSLSIDRFKDWSLNVAEIPIPDATDTKKLMEMEMEIERFKRWI